MTTAVRSDFETDWRSWHLAREQALAVPHGWLSLTGFHWLPGAPSVLPGLPGTFSVVDDHAVLTAGAGDGYTVGGDENGLQVPVDGTIRAQVAEAKSLDWLTLGEVRLELALRGGRYAIRTRDPQAPALRGFGGVPSFGVDEKWFLDGSFEAFDVPRQIVVGTARDDFVQQVTAVGTVTLTHAGQRIELIAGSGVGGTLNIAFHDLTNGDLTARWRAVSTTAPDAQGRVQIDFNRAVNPPFAFSAYGTCPAPVAGNALPFAVTAGELLPRNGSPV